MAAAEGARCAVSILVTGGSGQLGSVLAGFDGVRAVSRGELDITSVDAVDAAVSGASVVINAAAYTAVDAAETDADTAHAVNAVGPGVLAAACLRHDVPLIHISTDYVFPGDGSRPYEVGDETGPRSVYGRTKLAGELAVSQSGARTWVVRTSWVYGPVGGNFVRTMAALESTRDTLTVVDDQRGAPTYVPDLAAGLIELASRTDSVPTGVLHATGAGETTWCGFAKAIFTELGADPSRVQPCTTADFPRPAPRPAYSVLSNSAWIDAGLTPLRAWDSALTAAFAEHDWR
ncbi:dTDP-4-dehydrorhamnose reductase [Pseudonocardiaceae bacterium YIM PH 21723]|nr:dTDP-4-dehydrorhamnose reductase [Pseudonocardiaceae bacterium YIM PH 21723]